ncbi:unnamed protein product [Schistocephalus solidus]|uniref:Zinc transporter ZIP8 n=1 Tax=Schistocephalus solidus TaxID=70667 RepID=A0A183T076_SCHSO|nr:unnamed protein product [Schistocephalus solidus]
MASTLSFLTDHVSSSTVHRHWTLVIILFSLLNLDVTSNFFVQAVPVLRIYPMHEGSLVGPSINSSLPLPPFHLLPINNFTPTENPLVTISLLSLKNFSDSTTVLKISSQPDSSAYFVLDVSSPVSEARPPLTQAILFGFIGVTVTNVCALTGLIFVPLKRFRFYPILLTFLVSLAVGALLSTALLVLIPEAMRMVDMPAEFGGQGRFYLWKMVSVLLGCLFFYCLEYLLFIMPKLCKSEGDIFSKQSTLVESADDEVVISSKSCCCANFRCNTKQFTKIAPVAWMILLGDGFHNMMDGVTIGAGFSQSPILGLTLSLSILFEELPHELGDFAILISSGLSVKAALCSNFASACSAYLGLAIGLAIGEMPDGALYVFAVTAGLFLYISISDMLPTMRKSIEDVEKRSGSSYKIFLLQLVGFFVGFGCVIGVTISSDYINLQ